MLYGPLIAEVAVACDLLMHRAENPVDNMCDIISGYDRVHELEEEELDLLYDLILVRNGITVTIAAWRSQMKPDEEPYIVDIELYWNLINRILSEGREKTTARFRQACGFPVDKLRLKNSEASSDVYEDNLVEKRKALLGEHAWHFYDQPLHIVRASGPWLYDINGKRYLDMYNNVQQIGHCHPHVSRSISRQIKTLNINTRYMNESILDYAERLVSLTPDHLNACIFVNSGSEANDLAFQICKVETGNRGAVVVEEAYHGITESIQDLSPISRRGERAHIATFSAPCSYRGPHAGKESQSKLYAEDVDHAINELMRKGIKPACFMIDPSFCSNGILDVPEDYFARVEGIIRTAGGLIVVDEVQSGLGRQGRMWGHEAYNIEADIVTLGKPVGNGYPLGVLITRKTILDNFIMETDLFSTFGGNPVSCAAGMAVLDVLENEELIENAKRIGKLLRLALFDLAKKHRLIGDIRGTGMMIGVELVLDKDTKTPAVEQTHLILESMREKGVVVGRSGPFRNVLKLRPSLGFNKEQVEFFIQALDKSLCEIEF